MNPLMVFAVGNHKGGVGKSEVSRNLAAQFAKRNYRVLLVDLDDQGNLSEHFGFDIEDITLPCITNVLVDKTEPRLTMDDIVLNTRDLLQSLDPDCEFGEVEPLFDNIDLAPCNLTFDDASPVNMRTRTLLFALNEMQKEYDFVILDCPPNLKIVTENAFIAADFVIIPVEAGTPYITGITRTKEAILECAMAERVPPANWKILLNCIDTRTIRDSMGIEEVVETFGNNAIFETRIPESVKVGECRQINKIVSLQYPKMRVAEAFEALADELESSAKKKNDVGGTE